MKPVWSSRCLASRRHGRQSSSIQRSTTETSMRTNMSRIGLCKTLSATPPATGTRHNNSNLVKTSIALKFPGFRTQKRTKTEPRTIIKSRDRRGLSSEKCDAMKMATVLNTLVFTFNISFLPNFTNFFRLLPSRWCRRFSP